MSIATVRSLATAYALAAGNAIVLRVEKFGKKLPADMNDDYAAWLKTQEALAAAHPTGDGGRTLDPFVDRSAVLPAHIADSIIGAYSDSPVELDPAQLQRLADARSVRAAYPDDLRAVTNKVFVVEWKVVNDLLARLRDEADLQGAIARLGLASDVALATKLHAAYGVALGVSSETPDTPEAAALADWNRAFAVLALTATHLDRKHPGVLDLIAGPYGEQLERQIAAASRARARKLQAAASASDAPPSKPPSGG